MNVMEKTNTAAVFSKNSNQACYLSSELLSHVLSFVSDAKTLFSCAQVNKTWHKETLFHATYREKQQATKCYKIFMTVFLEEPPSLLCRLFKKVYQKTPFSPEKPLSLKELYTHSKRQHKVTSALLLRLDFNKQKEEVELEFSRVKQFFEFFYQTHAPSVFSLTLPQVEDLVAEYKLRSDAQEFTSEEVREETAVFLEALADVMQPEDAKELESYFLGEHHGEHRLFFRSYYEKQVIKSGNQLPESIAPWFRTLENKRYLEQLAQLVYVEFLLENNHPAKAYKELHPLPRTSTYADVIKKIINKLIDSGDLNSAFSLITLFATRPQEQGPLYKRYHEKRAEYREAVAKLKGKR